MARVNVSNRRAGGVHAATVRASGISISLSIALALALVATILGGMTSRALASTTFAGTLQPGQALFSGDSITSLSNPYRLTMRPDGNLVLDVCGRTLWTSRTAGNAGAHAVMRFTGDFVVVSAAGVDLWRTKTENHNNAYLAVQPDGNLVIYWPGAPGTKATPLWPSGTATGYTPICNGWSLFGNNSVVSPNKAFHLDMLTNGNLVLYQGADRSTFVWATWTTGGGAQATVASGQLVVELNGTRLYASPSPASSNAYLAVTDYGNVDLISRNGTTLWRARGLPKPTITTTWWGTKKTCPLNGVSRTPLKVWAQTGLVACGPGSTGEFTEFSSTPIWVEKWQCVELSERWLYQEFHLPQQYANGYQVAPAYEAYMAKTPGSRHHLVYETPTSPGAGIGPGDVMSYSDGGVGHTAVVVAVTDTSYTILSENWNYGYGDPTTLLKLVNGVPQGFTGYAVVGWLHDTE